MNCKPGDLAIVVRSYAGNEGKIVRCLKLAPGITRALLPNGDFEVGAIWEIDRPLKSWAGCSDKFAPDSSLRPIRDPGDDAVDETLLRLPSPRQEVTA